jgi:hypothetical protein
MGRIPKHPDQRKYTLSHMFEKHHEMARLVYLGFSNIEIAEALGCTPQNVSDCRNSPVFQDKVAFLRGNRDEAAVDVGKALKEDAPKSLALLQRVRDDENVDLKLRSLVARDMLDRAGHGKIQKIEGRHLHGHVVQTEDHLNQIKERAREARKNMQEAETMEVTDAEILEEAAAG